MSEIKFPDSRREWGFWTTRFPLTKPWLSDEAADRRARSPDPPTLVGRLCTDPHWPSGHWFAGRISHELKGVVSDAYARRIKEAGVKIAIHTDAHRPRQFSPEFSERSRTGLEVLD
jgi:hypothetical protein